MSLNQVNLAFLEEKATDMAKKSSGKSFGFSKAFKPKKDTDYVLTILPPYRETEEGLAVFGGEQAIYIDEYMMHNAKVTDSDFGWGKQSVPDMTTTRGGSTDIVKEFLKSGKKLDEYYQSTRGALRVLLMKEKVVTVKNSDEKVHIPMDDAEILLWDIGPNLMKAYVGHVIAYFKALAAEDEPLVYDLKRLISFQYKKTGSGTDTEHHLTTAKRMSLVVPHLLKLVKKDKEGKESSMFTDEESVKKYLCSSAAASVYHPTDSGYVAFTELKSVFKADTAHREAQKEEKNNE